MNGVLIIVNLYEQLGVGQTATKDEIKRAYFRMVRQYTPEKDPDAFMRIRKAYEELYDDETRSAYDAGLSQLADVPADVAEAIMQAEGLCKKRLSGDAIILLNYMLRVHLRNKTAANALQHALCKTYLETGKSGKAVAIAEELVSDNPGNKKYLSIAILACEERGWYNKADSYREDMRRLEPTNEDDVLAMLGDAAHPPSVMGRSVEDIEKTGRYAPILCLRILVTNLLFSPDLPDRFKPHEQMCLFSADESNGLPWNDLAFAAQKLAEHTAGFPRSGEKREALLSLLLTIILPKMYDMDEYGILPEIDRVISNIGADELRRTSEYEIVSVSHAAIKAVQAGIPKTLAALSVMYVLSKAEALNETEKREHRDEALSLELDILISFHQLKKGIKRFRDEFEELYSHSADFLDAVSQYNEQKLHSEANRRIARVKHIDSRFTLEWLGEDDDLEVYEAKQEPVRVTKTGRNEPCPCGSGQKYKRCCGR